MILIRNATEKKKNLISFSHLKSTQWNLLEKTWEKLFPSEKLKNFIKIIECNQLNSNKTDKRCHYFGLQNYKGK